MSAFLRSPRAWIPLLLVAVVALAFHPVVFGRYTISYSIPAIAPGETYHGSSLPLHDPSAGANQDEGWLHLIRDSLIHGNLPIVNMSNGLGAPLVESLQPGAFYVLNPLLLLLDPSTPRFFDAFSLLHVVLFVCGLYALLRLYASRMSSLAVAILVGLSGISVEHVNMVHFRCHAWFPLVLLGAVRIARGDRRVWPFFLFVLAHVAQITAGALQEAFVCSLAVGAVFLVEWWWAADTTVSRGRRLARMGLAVVASTAIAAVSFLPYLCTRASGDVLTASYPERSIEHASAAELSDFVLPNAVGFYPHMFTQGGMPEHWIPDFSTLGVFLVLAGVAALVFVGRSKSAGWRARYVALAALVAVGMAKIAGLPLFDFLEHIPFVSEVLFLKYHNWMFTIAAVLGAAGLDALVEMESKRRRWIVSGAVTVTVLLVVWLVSEAWERPLDELLARVPASTVHDAWWSYDTSIVALLAGVMLVWFRPRAVLACMVAIAIAHATLVLPKGWSPRAEKYAESVERTESNDPELAEPGQLGLRPRLLSRLEPNQNLIVGFEQIGVFDPVCNTRLVELLRAHFHLNHPLFDIQPFTSAQASIDADQLELLRFLGVSRIYGHDIDPTLRLPRTKGGGALVGRALPRVWLLSKGDADAIDARFGVDAMRDVVRSTDDALRANAATLDVHATAHGYDVRVSRDFEGELVVQQAYAQAWVLDNESGQPFCHIFPRWSVRLRAGQTYHVRYVPLGFRTGAIVSSLGLVLLALSVLFVLRRL